MRILVNLVTSVASNMNVLFISSLCSTEFVYISEPVADNRLVVSSNKNKHPFIHSPAETDIASVTVGKMQFRQNDMTLYSVLQISTAWTYYAQNI